MNTGRLAVGSAEYAHARLRARLGARPDEAAWHHIEITRDLAPLLELARGGTLARWVQGLPIEAGLHEIEQALRRRWREQVAELAGWMDAPWQAAIRWCALLVDLPVLAQWARGETLPAWVAADELLSDWLVDEPRGSSTGRHRATGSHLAALRSTARAAPDEVLDAWLRIWRDLLPQQRARAAIEGTLVPLLSTHARSFTVPATWHAQREQGAQNTHNVQGSPGATLAHSGWARRRALGVQLVALLRRHPAEPIEVFTFLALQALELERLRAEVCGRAAFPQRTLHA